MRYRYGGKLGVKADLERIAAQKKVWYETNRERIAAQKKAYREANRERVDAYRKAWYEANRGRRAATNKLWGAANCERKAAINKVWYETNRERQLERQRAWREANRERTAAYRKAWVRVNPGYSSNYGKTRCKTDLNFKLLKVLRSRLNKVLKAERSVSALKLVGCDLDWLKAWLEVQFKLGMTWENYGPVWHIDHIRPCNSFDLADLEQQRRCFHWTNLQPLFASENVRKNSKWDAEAA